MKFAYFGYRKWAEEILRKLELTDLGVDAFTIPQTEYSSLNFREKKIGVFNPKEVGSLDLEPYEALLFYGWSWMIPEDIVKEKDCVCLHPSPLPKYRGGSPLQHQIINGEDKSAVTLFKMGEKLDDGPIYYQKPFSLEGRLSDVFDRIVDVGSSMTINLLDNFENNNIETYQQNEAESTTYKRRRKSESELTSEMLKNMGSRQIHDFIRALQDPYPNAYIVGKDNRKIYLTDSKLEE